MRDEEAVAGREGLVFACHLRGLGHERIIYEKVQNYLKEPSNIYDRQDINNDYVKVKCWEGVSNVILVDDIGRRYYCEKQIPIRRRR